MSYLAMLYYLLNLTSYFETHLEDDLPNIYDISYNINGYNPEHC